MAESVLYIVFLCNDRQVGHSLPGTEHGGKRQALHSECRVVATMEADMLLWQQMLLEITDYA